MALKLALFHQALAKPDVFLISFFYLTEDRLFCITYTLFKKQKIIKIMIMIMIIIIIVTIIIGNGGRK